MARNRHRRASDWHEELSKLAAEARFELTVPEDRHRATAPYCTKGLPGCRVVCLLGRNLCSRCADE